MLTASGDKTAPLRVAVSLPFAAVRRCSPPVHPCSPTVTVVENGLCHQIPEEAEDREDDRPYHGGDDEEEEVDGVPL